jgi:hypothetical protein
VPLTLGVSLYPLTPGAQTAYRFDRQQATTQRQALPAGDYGVALDNEILAVVERKSLDDLALRLIDGNLTYALAELATVERAAIVVEDLCSALFKLEHVPSGFAAELLARLQARYPNVPIVFCDTRPLAEEWTYRFMGAALAYLDAEHSRNHEADQCVAVQGGRQAVRPGPQQSEGP